MFVVLFSNKFINTGLLFLIMSANQSTARVNKDALLDRYCREVALCPVMGPGEEFEIAKNIEKKFQDLVGYIGEHGRINGSPAVGLQLLGRKIKETGQEEVYLEFSRLEQQIHGARKIDGPNIQQMVLDHYQDRLFKTIKKYTDWKPLLREVGEELIKTAKENQPTNNEHSTSQIPRCYKLIKNQEKELVQGNLRLVVAIANRYKYNGKLSLNDLVQEGNIGLIKAVDRFDYQRGNRFSTYAGWWVRHTIVRALADKGLLVREPVHINIDRQKYNRTISDLTTRLGRKPNHQEISAYAGLPLSKVKKLWALSNCTFSLDGKISEEDDRSFVDLLTDVEQDTPEKSYIGGEFFHLVEGILGDLEPMEEDILRKRFGLGGGPDCLPREELTLREVGEDYELSRERIRQIQKRALEKIRRALRRRKEM